YESVTVMISDPNITEYNQWWAPKSLPNALKIRTKPGECEETKLPLNTPLRTNSPLPLFSYDALRGETPYKANPLNVCKVQSMALTMEPKFLSFVLSSTILCEPTGDPPRARRFQTSFKRAEDPRLRPDTIIEYMEFKTSPNETDLDIFKGISQDGPPKDQYFNVLGVIDALGSDLIRVMCMRRYTWGYVSTAPVPEAGYIAWDPGVDYRAPTDESRFDGTWGTYADGFWYPGDYIRLMNITIINMFVAIRDAIQ
ncbi:hypothetical protein FRC07_002575, partial [Ceratobasidium sp. 392]